MDINLGIDCCQLFFINYLCIGANHVDSRHKLDKETASRHFPEWDHGGKGSHARRYDSASKSAYAEGWARIFGRGNAKGESK